MATTAPHRVPLLTAEDLAELPDDVHAELVDGHLLMIPPAFADHGSVVARTTAAIAAWVYAHALGELFDSQTGFVLRRNPDVVRSPDLSFVSAARLASVGGAGRGFVEVGPDLAVEVLSASNTVPEMTRKLADYYAAGTRLVWFLDPRTRTATVHTPDRLVPRRVAADGALDGGDVLPGFELLLARCFAGLAPLDA